MERWRWLPRDLGTAYVMVNLPDYTLTVMNDGKPVWSTRIVVGQPGKHATPLLAETIKYITFNPTWNVPPSIIRNEYLPALARDPTALARIGLRIGRNSDGSIRIYQPPSDRNSLCCAFCRRNCKNSQLDFDPSQTRWLPNCCITATVALSQPQVFQVPMRHLLGAKGADRDSRPERRLQNAARVFQLYNGRSAREKQEANKGSGEHKTHAGQKQSDVAKQRIGELR